MQNGEQREEQLIEVDGRVFGMTELVVRIVAIGGMVELVQAQKAGSVIDVLGERAREVGERTQQLLEAVHLVMLD